MVSLVLMDFKITQVTKMPLGSFEINSDYTKNPNSDLNKNFENKLFPQPFFSNIWLCCCSTNNKITFFTRKLKKNFFPVLNEPRNLTQEALGT